MAKVVLVHCRVGRVYFFDDALNDLGCIKCGNYSFCKMTIIALENRYLAALPSLTTSEALDIWDLEHKSILISGIQSLTEKNGVVMCAKFVHNSQGLTLLAGFDDGVVRAFKIDLTNRLFEELIRMKLFDMTVTCLDYHCLQESAIVGGPKSDLVLIKNLFSNDRSISRALVINEGFSDLNFSPSGQLIISGGWDGKIRFFAAEDLLFLGLSNVHSDTILDLSVLRHEEGLIDARRRTRVYHDLLIATSQDNTISIWSLDLVEIASINL